MEKKMAKIIQFPGSDKIPVDVAISNTMRNMFLTFGEEKVRASLKELFGMDSKVKKSKRKAA